jgi:hypothetical protein
MTAASQKEFTNRILLLAILTAQAELALIPGGKLIKSKNNEGQTHWIEYPAVRAEHEETVTLLTRTLANAHGIPATYPPMG